MILIGIYLWNLIVLGVFFFGLLSFRMLTLKFSQMMIGQCLEKCWIIVWKLFVNTKTEHEWTLYTHIICIDFHISILRTMMKKVTWLKKVMHSQLLEGFKCESQIENNRRTRSRATFSGSQQYREVEGHAKAQRWD
jgi:hypothetical protein